MALVKVGFPLPMLHDVFYLFFAHAALQHKKIIRIRGQRFRQQDQVIEALTQNQYLSPIGVGGGNVLNNKLVSIFVGPKVFE
jgi:hypothetical protein